MRLNRRQALIGASASLALPWARPSYASPGSVNVYNWADYIGETTIEDFASETGIDIVYDLYASAEDMEAKMLAGSSGYDVVLQSGLGLHRLVAANLYQKIDRARLQGWDTLNPEILKILQGFDPENSHGVPYTWGTVGFTFNVPLVRERLPDVDLTTLDAVFLPENAAKLADCGISLLDSPTDIGFMVMRWLGLDADAGTPETYAQMAEAFARIREHVTTFDNTNFLTSLPNQEICVANTWSGDYAVAKARAAEAGIEVDLVYHVPKTGAPAWFDLWAIPADAANVDNAYTFLNYMLRPEAIAELTNSVFFANANRAAGELVDAAITGDPDIYPPAEVRARLFSEQLLPLRQQRERTRIWTTFRSQY